MIKPPPKSLFPNWKVYSLLMWIEFIFLLIWMIDDIFNMEETNMRFKGHHAEK